MQKLNEREKYLADKYVYLIDKYFRIHHSNEKERDDCYCDAAIGLIYGVRTMDNAAATKTFSDEEGKELYYENYLLLSIHHSVCRKYEKAGTLSRGREYINVLMSEPIFTGNKDDVTLEDTLKDTSSASEYKAVEDRLYIDGLLHGCTALQRMICVYIACGYTHKEISERLNVSVDCIRYELKKLRNKTDVALQQTNKSENKKSPRYIRVVHGRYIIQLVIEHKQYRIVNIAPDKAELVRDELLHLREIDPKAAIKRIEEIKADLKSSRQRQNKNHNYPRNIIKYTDSYAVIMRVDGVREHLGNIPTLDEAVKVRDDLIAARNIGFDTFCKKINSYREKYGSI